MTAKLAGAGRLFDINHWNDLGDNEANTSSDNPASSATPLKVGSTLVTAMRVKRNQHWGIMDLVPSHTADDPEEVVARRLAAYWTRQFQLMVIASCKGILAENVAADSGDMVDSADYSDVVAGSLTASNYFNMTGFLRSIQTLGDASDKISAIAVHSVTYRTMQRLDMVEYTPLPVIGSPTAEQGATSTSGINPRPSQTDIRRVASFLGHSIIVDDSMWTTAGTNSPKYTSVIFGPGAFGFGETTPKTPAEITREALQGDGEGQEIVSSRREFMLHPVGHDILDAGVAGQSATNAELALAAAWDRKFERKLIPIAFYEHN
jgi:hypothetical protein